MENLIFVQLSRAGDPTMPSFYDRRDYLGLASEYIVVGDVNGDGIPDLVAPLQGYNQVLFGNGDGTFRTGVSGLTGLAFASFVSRPKLLASACL